MPDQNTFPVDFTQVQPDKIPLVASMTLEHVAGAVEHHRRFNEMAGQYAEAIADHLPPGLEVLTVAFVNLAGLDP